MTETVVPRLALVVGSQCATQQKLSFLPELATELYELLINPNLGACTAALADPERGGLLIDPTRQQALDALDIAFDSAGRARATLVVAFLGHGIVKANDFYYLTVDSLATGRADHDIALAPILKERLRDNTDISALLVLVDTCHAGVAAQAAMQWAGVGLEGAADRFAILSATDGGAAYRGDYTRSLIAAVEQGIPSAGATIEIQQLRRALQDGAPDQQPQHLIVDGGPWEGRRGEGLWIARNVAVPSESRYTRQGRVRFLALAKASSISRQEQRRRSAGLTDEQPQRLGSPELPVGTRSAQFGTGMFKVLAGPLGAGKSEIAETWLQLSIIRADADTSAPVPLWAAARQLPNSIEAYVLDQVGEAALDSCGVDFVIDGVDEGAWVEATTLVQAEELVTHWPRSRILITSRASAAVSATRLVEVDPLTQDQAVRIMSQVAGSDVSHLARRWPAALIEATRRPLFALLAAREINDITGSTGAAELIDLLVDYTVERYSLHEDVYRDIAVHVVRTGGPVDMREVLSAATEADLRRSPLLTVNRHAVSFSLATFEQWFAAQALIRREVGISEILRDLRTFNRWRYVLSIVLATGPPARVDDIMESVVTWNPGAAGWVVDEALNGPMQRTGPAISAPDWRGVAGRIRRATIAWLTGFGPAAATLRLGPVL
ncbi:hypothetical protein [Nocardia sp. NPDC003963]